MPRHARDIMATVRRLLREETTPDVAGNNFFDPHILDLMDEAHDHLLADLLESYEDYLVEFRDLDLVAGQASVDLPAGCVRLKRLHYIADGTNGLIPENRISGESDILSGVAAIPGSGPPFAYALSGDHIDLDPVPGSNATGAIRCWFARRAPKFHLGKALAAAASTITLQNVEDANGNQRSPLTDDYKYQWIVTTGGTGAGQRRRVASYDGATGIATISPNWSPTPDTTTLYAFETPYPDPADRLIALLAATFSKEPMDESSSRLEDRINALHDQWISIIEKRTHGFRGQDCFMPDDGVIVWG